MPARLCEELDKLLDQVKREPITQEELARAKARVELASLQGLDTVSGKATQIGFSETVLGEPGTLFTKLEAYRRASRSDVLRAARRYLVQSARTLVEVLANDQGAGDEPGAQDAEDADDAEGAEGDEA